MKAFYLRVFFATLLVGAGYANAENEEAAKALLTTVNVSDGINLDEAQNIAKAYFLYNVGCGAYTGVTDAENKWNVQGGFGYSGDPIVGFFIDKQTGAITSPIGPSYNSPIDLLNEL